VQRNYYEVLGIGRGASNEEVKEAYRDLAKKHHPDVSGCAGDPARFRELEEAYETLRDHDTRRRYDQELTGRSAREAEVASARPGFVRPGFVRPGFVRPGFVRPGSGASRYDRAERGGLHADLVLSRSEAARGGRFTIRVPLERARHRPPGWPSFSGTGRGLFGGLTGGGLAGGLFADDLLADDLSTVDPFRVGIVSLLKGRFGRRPFRESGAEPGTEVSFLLPPGVPHGTTLRLQLDDAGFPGRVLFLRVMIG